MIAQPPSEGLTVTWIGHSTLLVQMDDVSVLTDPVFGSSCGPIRVPGVPTRFRPAACGVADLPHIDAVVISHNHFDHLDSQSVTDLNRRFGLVAIGSLFNWCIVLICICFCRHIAAAWLSW